MIRRPKFFVKESEKTPEWMKETALGISDIMVGILSKTKDRDCWDFYNELDNETDFEYLTKIGENILPARVRHIGIQRPKINYLAGRQSKRPLNFSVILADTNSLKTKQKNISKGIFDKIKIKAQERSYILNISLGKIEQQKKRIQEQLGQLQESIKDPNLEPQQLKQLQQQYQELIDKMPEIQENIDIIQNGIQDELFFNKQELDDLKRYNRYTYRDLKEELAQKVVKDLINTLDIKRKSKNNFVSSLVTGKEFFFIDQLPGEIKPRFDIIPDLKVFFPSDPQYKWTHLGRWIATEEQMSYETIKMEFSKQPGWDEDMDKRLELLSNDYSYDTAFLSKTGNTATDIYSGSTTLTTNGINVRRVWWKTPRKALFKVSPNPYISDKTFTHIIDNGKTIIDPSDYKYKDGKYINKVNKEIIYDKDKVETVDKNKNENVEERWIDDIYQAVILNREFAVGYKLKPIIIRSLDNPSEAFLPIVGRTYSDVTERPYSLIWATRHLQTLYKIVSFQKELLIALSGVKGTIIDLSQKPSNMSREEQYYHRKQGSLYIQTTDAQGKPIKTSFNQWKDFDDTMSPNIVNLDIILNNIDIMCHKIMGINPQVMGQLEPDQLNGTMEMAKTQAEMITSSLFYNHDEVIKEAFNVLINIACKYSYSKETLLNIVDDDMGVELVKIQNDILNSADYKFIMMDNLKDEIELKELKLIALKQSERGLIPFDKMMNLYNVNSVKELVKKIEYYTQTAQELSSANEEQREEKALEFEKAKISFAKEYDLIAKRETNKIAETELQLRKAELQLKKWEIEQNNTIEKYHIDTDNKTRQLGIGAEREVEATYLQEQNRAANAQEQLQAIKLELDAIQTSLQDTLKHTEINSKHDIEIKKAKVIKKERNTL
jgi:hypothetical protein